MKANYHTHTFRCHHASGNDEDYVKSAIAAGFQELGFSDHSPWKYQSNYVSHMRMKLDTFADYKKSVLSLKEKYKDKIAIKLGLECEYFERYIPWLKEFILENQIDYIIFGNHYYETDEIRRYFGTICTGQKELEMYKDHCIKGMESGLYSCLCHPELFMRAYDTFDQHCEKIAREICWKAKELKIPLEYNLAGLAYNRRFQIEAYPHHRFWEIAKEIGNDCIIGVDAHSNVQLEDEFLWNEAKNYLNQLGMQPLELLPMPDFSKIIK